MISFESVLNDTSECILKAAHADGLSYYRDNHTHLDKSLQEMSYEDLRVAIDCMIEEQKRIKVVLDTIKDTQDCIREMMKL